MKSRSWFALSVVLCGFALAEVRSAQLSGPTRFREVTRHDEPRVWVVDSAGAGDFLDLPEAVAAARSGDVIVVRQSGMTYAGFTTSKGLTIVGEAGPVGSCDVPGPGPYRPCVSSRVRIEALPEGEELVLRGLDLDLAFEPRILDVVSCAGVVWVEDCPITSGCFLCFGEDASSLTDSPKVVWIRSPAQLQGFITFGGPSILDVLELDDASLFAFESSFVGHNGMTSAGGSVAGGSGGPGARLLGSSFLFASGSTFHGGAAGGHGCTGFDGSICVSGGAAGTGLRAEGTSQALLLDSLTLGGPGTPAMTCFAQTCPATPTGNPRLGMVTDIPLPARTLEVGSPVVAGGSYHLSVSGQPGETVFTMYSEHAEATYVPLYFGPQLTAHPITFGLEGAIPASGTLEKDVPVPPISLLTRFHRSFVQGLLFDELGNAYQTSGSVLVVLAE